MTDTFLDHAFPLTVGLEGGYDRTAADRGNWTSGRVGTGELRGTKFGISAAAYPAVDIESLTLDDAQAIYRHDYWGPVNGDALPPPLAVLAFDAAVNSGVRVAATCLQAAVGVRADGVVGPLTIAAAQAAAPFTEALTELQARRCAYIGGASGWYTFGLGWSRRLFKTYAYALNMKD